MKKQIYTDFETKAFLTKAFKCSRQAVWLALTFQRDSDMARRMRVLALKKGGTLVGATLPEWETTHEEAEYTMTQTYGDRVRLVCDKNTGDVSVFFDDRLRETHRNMDAPGLMRLQKEIETAVAAL